MSDGDVHTVHQEGVWMNEVTGFGQPGGIHRIKEDAIEAGRELAVRRDSEHLIHGLAGEVDERRTYGNVQPDAAG